MAESKEPCKLYYAVRIVQIIYKDLLRDTLPKYYVLKRVYEQTEQTVREHIKTDRNLLIDAKIYCGKYNPRGLFGYISEVLDQEVLAYKGRPFVDGRAAP